jgi:hypothetical protein
VESVELLQLVSRGARMDMVLQLITDQLNKLSAGQETMKNYKVLVKRQ